MIFRHFCRLLCALVIVSCCHLPSWGDLLVGTAFEGGVRRIDETTGQTLPNGIAPGSAGLAFTSGVTVGPDGNIYVSSRGTGEVLFYDGTTGQPLPSPHEGGRAGLYATLATATTPMSTPGPLRFGPDGHLYVSDFGGTSVRKFDGTTGMEMAPAATVFVGPPAGLAFGPDDALYVGDFGSASVLRVEGGVPAPYIPPQSGGLQTASSLIFAPNGDLLVVDLFGNQILRFDAATRNPSQFAVIPPAIPDPLPPGANFPSNNPSDAALDANGNLVVAVLGLTNPPDNRGAVLRYDLQGNLLETLLDQQTQFGSIARISSVSVLAGDYDGNGMVQAADYEQWKSAFGAAVAAGTGADGNGNGMVDAADYAVWRNAAASAAGNATAVPEPAAATLVLVLVLLGLPVRTIALRRL